MQTKYTFTYSGPLPLGSVLNHVCASVGLHRLKHGGQWVLEAQETEGEYILKVWHRQRHMEISRFVAPANSDGRSALSKEVLHYLRQELLLELSPWGVLVGVRPMKLYRKYLARFASREILHNWLLREKEVSSEKIALMEAIERVQAPYIASHNEKKVAIYGSIPFCTSHCSYCSFPFGLIQQFDNIDTFIHIFNEDSHSLKELVNYYGLDVDSIYVGGGTPSSLDEENFARMIETMAQFHKGTEFTIEVGRPDTLSKKKIDTMLRWGVNRISLNPQTMHDDILKLIGRHHSIKDIDDMLTFIRKASNITVNMDFICGLPTHELKHIKENMDYVCNRQPENVTIHTLAIKRGSPLYNQKDRYTFPSSEALTEMVVYCRERLLQAGYVPYYIYRQQYMGASLENVGYTLPDKVCVYNIHMMEERQPIFAIGPGGTSKWMKEPDYRQIKQYMPKDVYTYMEEKERLLAMRKENFANFYGEDR